MKKNADVALVREPNPDEWKMLDLKAVLGPFKTKIIILVFDETDPLKVIPLMGKCSGRKCYLNVYKG